MRSSCFFNPAVKRVAANATASNERRKISTNNTVNENDRYIVHKREKNAMTVFSSVKRPHLFIFDFDETLSVRSSCAYIEDLAPAKDQLNLPEINQRYEAIHHCWHIRMNDVYKRLAELGVDKEQMLARFRAIELSPGTEELFVDINRNNHRIVIMSNACDLVIEECLRARNLLQYVEKIESNPVRQTDPFIVADPYENPFQTACKLCDPNLCKGLIIARYRERNLYDKIIFAGDGDNDVCAALKLNPDDHVFAKYDETTNNKVYQMYKLLKTKHFEQLRTELCTWKTMNDVHQILRNKNIL